MLVDFKNICFNTTLNIVRGKGSLQQSTFAWGEGFHGSPLAVRCLYPPKLSLWLISQERNICPFPFFYPQCVWAAVCLQGEGTGSRLCRMLLRSQNLTPNGIVLSWLGLIFSGLCLEGDGIRV